MNFPAQHLIEIKGELYSKKNSKQAFYKNGRMIVIPSKTYNAHIKELQYELLRNKPQWLEMIKGQKKPYKLHIYFHRKTKARFDGINLAQGLFDEMTNIGYWEDDNMDVVLPQFEGWEVDKENPRTLLWL